jgi:hypothetical protein
VQWELPEAVERETAVILHLSRFSSESVRRIGTQCAESVKYPPASTPIYSPTSARS